MKMPWAAFGLAVVTLLPVPAAAALKLCNRTSYILDVATGVERAGTVVTAGWIRLIPGFCKTVLDGDLSTQTTFVYARSARAYDGPRRAWGGSAWLCARTSDFHSTAARGNPNCQGAHALPFFRIDPHGQPSWTQTFGQTPSLATARAAQAAGLARLLSSAGLNGAHPAHALAAFRARMHIASTAPISAVFDALESAALSRAAPNGYGVCNDTSARAFVALADHEQGQWHTRGWWQVGPGRCVQALTAKLAGPVYLLAEGPKGRRLVTGRTRFCITDITFDVEGQGSCSARGLKAAGFETTNLRHRPGYTAHVSEHGLVPEPR